MTAGEFTFVVTENSEEAATGKKDDTELKLRGTKTLTGRTMKAGEFDFVVKEGTETVTTGRNVGAQSGEEAAIEFDQIRYTQADIGEHTYTVTEVTPAQAHVTQDGTTSFTVKVKVFADENGELQAEVLEDGSDTVAFTNKYEDTAEFLLQGTKTLTGRDMKENEFSFVVKEGDTVKGGQLLIVLGSPAH